MNVYDTGIDRRQNVITCHIFYKSRRGMCVAWWQWNSVVGSIPSQRIFMLNEARRYVPTVHKGPSIRQKVGNEVS